MGVDKDEKRRIHEKNLEKARRQKEHEKMLKQRKHEKLQREQQKAKKQKEKLRRQASDRTQREMRENAQKKKKKEAERKRKHLALVREQEKRRVQKEREKAERQARHLASQNVYPLETVDKLKRTVVVSFDYKAIVPELTNKMKNYGEIESAKISMVGFTVRYKSVSSAKKAKNKKITSNLPTVVTPEEIKHHAVYFEAPEEMGEIGQDVLSGVEAAMGAYGTIVNVKKKGRCIVIFFDNKESVHTLSPNESDDVTVEFEGHTVALVKGVPPTQRKRRNIEIQEKKARLRIEAKNNKKLKINKRN